MQHMQTPTDAGRYDQPYPLQRLFRRRILPLFLLLAAAFCAVAGWGGTRLMQSVYMEFAARRAQIIDTAMTREIGPLWSRLLASTAPRDLFAGIDGPALVEALRSEERELSLSQLKIYGAGGLILYSTEADRIGSRDASAAFQEAWHAGAPSLVRKTLPEGGALYELYVPMASRAGAKVVFELYEPVGTLDALLLRSGAPAIALPLTFLALLAAVTAGLVGRAQGDIDRRSGQLVELRQRLERFLSRSAADAARDSLAAGDVRSRKIDCTLLMSDVRDFTAFSERTPAEDVVAFLNRVMAIQVAAIDARDGDVDKMIGDAVLARFDGPNRERRAIEAARRLLADLAAANLPRGVGVGIYSGPVISGAIGPPDRQDFTVIGDSVNVAARLCSAAHAGELVVDEASAAAAGIAHGECERLTVKGRREPISVLRLSASG